MSTNSVEIQLQKAIEMKETVQDFAKILNSKMDDLNDMLDFYVRAGFPSDVAAIYRVNYYMPDRAVIDGLCQKMLTEHVDFLDNVIEDLTKAKERQ